MPENHISGVVVNVLAVVALSVVDRGFEFLSAQAKENNIGMCCFSILNYVALHYFDIEHYSRYAANLI
jgi:hypothetical protein